MTLRRRFAKKAVAAVVVPVIAALGAAGLVACAADETASVPVPGRDGVVKTAAVERAERRLFDGAPPVIPHQAQGMDCIACHNDEGMAVDGLGFAPPSPHEATEGLSAISNCRQCHVFQVTSFAVESDGAPRAPFVANHFVGLRQDLRAGRRLFDGAPPVMPHATFMRENCQACHAGPAAREEIRTSHPERLACWQCHVEQQTSAAFSLGRL